MMLSHKGEKLNQKSLRHKLWKDVHSLSFISGILPLIGDFELHLMNVCCPTLGKLTTSFATWSNPHPLPASPPAPRFTLIGALGARKSVSRNLYIFQQLFSVFLHSPLWLVHEKWQLSQLMIAKTWSLTEEYLARISLLVFCRWLLGVFSLLSDHIGDWNTVCRFCNMSVLFPLDKYIWVMSSFILTPPTIAYKPSNDKFLLILPEQRR